MFQGLEEKGRPAVESLNIVIPPLVVSCKILIISVNFLEALAAIGRGDFRLCCCPSQIPIFGVSHCLKCLWCCLQRTMWSMWLTLFYSFVLSPIAVVAAIGLGNYTDTLSKPGCEGNILVIFFNFCHSFMTSINLHVTSTFFMLDNEQFIHLHL